MNTIAIISQADYNDLQTMPLGLRTKEQNAALRAFEEAHKLNVDAEACVSSPEQMLEERLAEEQCQREYDICYKTHNLIEVPNKIGNHICCKCGNHFVKTQGGIGVGSTRPSLKQKLCR